MKNFGVLPLVVLSVSLLFACSAPSLTPGKGSTGNPPLIPHEIAETDNGADCLGCHADGEDGAPKVPKWHSTLLDCRQCHVPMVDGIQPFKTQY